jgi:hypothetical protein
MCSDRELCKAKYTYNERKQIQGKEVDIRMIREQKASSIKLPSGVKEKEINQMDDRLLGDNYFVIDNPGDEYRYQKLKEAIRMNVMLNSSEGDDDMSSLMDRFSALVALAENPADEEAKKVIYENLGEEDIPEPIYTDNYQENYSYGGVPLMRVYDFAGNSESEDDEEEREETFDMESGLDALIERAEAANRAVEEKYEEDRRTQEDAYLDEVRKRQNEEKNAKKEQKTNSEKASSKEVPADVLKEAVEEATDAALKTVLDTIPPELMGHTEEFKQEVEERIKKREDAKRQADEDETPTVYSTADNEPEPDTAESKIYVNGKPIRIGEEVTTHVGNE